MDELLDLLFAAAIQLSGLPATETRPPVIPLPHAEMLAVVCAELAPTTDAERSLARPAAAMQTGEEDPHPAGSHERCLAQGGLVAAYLPGQFRIVYRDDLDLANDADNSFIVHEFVHALQERRNGARTFATCTDVIATEREAYTVQQQYLHSRSQLLYVGGRLRHLTCNDIL